MRTSVAIGALWMALLTGQAQAGTTIDAAHPYAYGANLGWIKATGDGTNGAVIGQFYCTGLLWSANCGWISLGNGPTNHWQYANASSNDWGVNHDGQGRLRGYAYGANIGWIQFEQTWGQPRVDLVTGVLSGYAYGANVGWISLSNAYAVLQTTRLDAGPDTDGDSLPDAFEYSHTNTLTALDGRAGHDADSDGATDLDEAGAGTDPLNSLSRLEITALQRLSGTNQLTWTVVPTRLYRIEHTGEMANTPAWTNSTAGTMLSDPSPVMTRNIPDPSSTTRFYRIKALIPLSGQ